MGEDALAVRGAVRDGRMWLAVAIAVFGLTLAAALWRANEPAGADPVGWEINRSDGWQSGGCDSRPAGPEDVRCTDTRQRRTGVFIEVWKHVNLWNNTQTPYQPEPFDNCSRRWTVRTDAPNLAAVRRAAEIGRGCLHNEPWPWAYITHIKELESRTEITVPEHKWVRYKAAHTNCPGFPFDHPKSIGGAGCPTTTTTAPPEVCPRGTDHAGQTVESVGGRDKCNDPEPVCPRGTDHAGQTIESVGGRDKCNDPPPPEVCPVGTDHAGTPVRDVGGRDKCDDPPGCEVLPSAPRNLRQSSPRNAQVSVRWSRPLTGSTAPCAIRYRVREVPSGGSPVDRGTQPAGDRSHRVTQPRAGQGPLRVQVQAVNQVGAGPWAWISVAARAPEPPPPEVCPPGTDHEGTPVRDVGGRDGCDDEDDPVVCPPGTDHAGETVESVGGRDRCDDEDEPQEERCSAVPGVPPVSWSQLVEQVSWSEPNAGGTGCTVDAYRVKLDPTGAPALPPVVLPVSSRSRPASQPAPGHGPLTVLVGARNSHGWGDYGRVTVPEQVPAGCTVPAAPVLRFGWHFNDSNQVVEWTLAEPRGADCEVTRQQMRRVPQQGYSWLRDLSATSRSYVAVTVTDVTGDVVVSVRAENKAGWGGWGDLTLTPKQVDPCSRLPSSPGLRATDRAGGQVTIRWGVGDGDPTGRGDRSCNLLAQEFKVSHEPGVRNLGPDDRSEQITEPDDDTGTVTVEARARNEVGWGEWGRLDVPAVCTQPPGVPDITVGDRERRGSRDVRPVSVTADPGGVFCAIDRWAWTAGGGITTTPNPSFTVPHPTSNQATRRLSVAARNQVGWGPPGTAIITACTAPPTKPDLAVVPSDGAAAPGTVRVAWTVEPGEVFCVIDRQQLERSRTVGTHITTTQIDPAARDQVLRAPTSWTETVRVRARNQHDWGPWSDPVELAPLTCDAPPAAPALVWDHVYDGPAWTKLTTVADMGGEGCAVVRYDTEYQHQSTTFADTYLAFQPDDPWFGTSKRQFRRIGEPTGATGHITYRVRAVNHRDGGTSTTPRSQPREVRV